MLTRDRISEKIEELDRHWPRIQQELEQRGTFTAFCTNLSELLTAIEALDEDADWRTAREDLSAVLERYRVDAILEMVTIVYRGGGALESYTTRGGRSPRLAARSLRSRIGTHAAPRRHVEPIVAFPELQAPEEARVGAAFRVQVRTLDVAPQSGAEPLKLQRDKEGPVDLEVELLLPRELEARGAKQAVLRVPETGESATIVFVVVGATAGNHEVRVELRRDGVTSTTLSARVLVRDEPRAEEAPLATIETVRMGRAERPATPGGVLVLRLQPNGESGDKRFFRVHLGGDGRLVAKPATGIIELDRQAASIVGNLCRRMHDLLPRTGAESREMRIQRLGLDLGRTLLPEPVRNALREVPPGTMLHIESDDAWAPWEAIAIAGPQSTFYLGEKFAVTRSLRNGSMRLEIEGGPATLVAPRRAGLDVRSELLALERISKGKPRVLEGLHEVQACLSVRAPRCAFLHFACHGRASPDDLASARLELDDGSLQLIDVDELQDWTTEEPLVSSCVFINACEGDVQERRLSGHGNWAERFLAAGATAVVAPAWSVKDSIATSFAARFYDALGEGKTAGESAREARSKMSADGQPDRLAYAVYASPWARLAEGSPAKASRD